MRPWLLAAALWGFAEGALFFIVPDVLLSFVGLKRGARAGLAASLVAACGAGLGGFVMYSWASADAAAARAAVEAVPAVSAAMIDAAGAAMARDGWFAATLAGPLSSTPYKAFAILAPAAGAPLILFVLGSVLARLPRFAAVALATALARRALAPRLGEGRLAWALGAFWLVFYIAFFAVMPN